MAMESGDAYFTIKRGDRTRSAHTTYAPTFPLLDTRVAPVEKQMRVFVDGTEYTYDDDTLIARPTTNKWSYTDISTAPTTGVRCWSVRLQFDPVGEGINDDPRTCCILIYDEDGNQMDLTGDLDESYVSGLNESQFNNITDLDPATGYTGSGTASYGNSLSFDFPEPRIVTKVAWGRNHTGGGSDLIENMRIQLDIGSGEGGTRNWLTLGDNATHAVQNSQDSHAAGAELDTSDYPTHSNPIVPATELLWFDTTSSGLDGTNLDAVTTGQVLPLVTITPAPTSDNERILLLRETRQDAPWVRPIPGARAHAEQIMVFYEQLRFIVQELCELETVSGFFSLGISAFNRNDYSTSGVSQTTTLAASTGPCSYSTVDLLDTVPGAELDDRHQLVVEQKTASATWWSPMTYNAAPTTDSQYSVDSSAKTITLGDTYTGLVRVRRSTKTDDWWYDPRSSKAPGWTSMAINATQRQARYMIEEACFLPAFYIDSPLSNSIFPRGWNWFQYVGTRNQWTIPVGPWGGGGEVEIFVNNVPVDGGGEEYTIEWPGITWTPGNTPGSGSTTTVGGGNTGGGWTTGGLGGGGETEETGNPSSTGGNETPNIEWPGFNIPASLGISISIGGKSRTALATGDWEGGTSVGFSQGNSSSGNFATTLLRVQITVTAANTVSDGGGGFLSNGATQVLYIGKYCDEGEPWRCAAAYKTSGAGAWISDEGSEALGCLESPGANAGPSIWALASPTLTSDSDARLKFVQDMYAAGGGSGDTELLQQIRGFGAWQELRDQSINYFNEGLSSEEGFTGEQFQNYLDPDVDFTDFDIPDP
jgi:hypothetical protein